MPRATIAAIGRTISRHAEQIRSVPHHIERLAAGVMHGAAVLTAAELAEVSQRKNEINKKRKARAAAKAVGDVPKRHGWRLCRRFRNGAGLWVFFGDWASGSKKGYRVMRGSPVKSGATAVAGRTPREAILAAGKYAERLISPGLLAIRRRRREWQLYQQQELGPVRYYSLRQVDAGYIQRASQEAANAALAEEAEKIRKKQAEIEWMRPAKMRLADDGGLLGVRSLVWAGGVLISPQRKTEWRGPMLTAEKWRADGALRNECGIHAVWMFAAGQTHERMADYRAIIARFDGCNTPILAVVCGYGGYVAGHNGWRAERQVLQEIYAPAKIAGEIAARYPEVPVIAVGVVEEATATMK